MANNEPISLEEALFMSRSKRGYQRRQELIDKHKETMASMTQQEREALALKHFGAEALSNPLIRLIAGL